LVVIGRCESRPGWCTHFRRNCLNKFVLWNKIDLSWLKYPILFFLILFFLSVYFFLLKLLHVMNWTWRNLPKIYPAVTPNDRQRLTTREPQRPTSDTSLTWCTPSVLPSNRPTSGYRLSVLVSTSSQRCWPLQFFLNLRNFETERDTSEKHRIKSLDLQEIYQFDHSSFVVSRFVPQLPRFKKKVAVNTFLTDSTRELPIPFENYYLPQTDRAYWINVRFSVSYRVRTDHVFGYRVYGKNINFCHRNFTKTHSFHMSEEYKSVS